MNVMQVDTDVRSACASCLRRSWLLAQLSGPLDCNCRSDGRLIDLLALADEELIKALGGRRAAELRALYASFVPGELLRVHGVAEICRHDERYPRALRAAQAPAMLFAAGGLASLLKLLARPVVAIVGTRRPTDYGIEMATALARGLAASGVTVAGEPADGIGQAVLASALQGGNAALSVLPGGVDVAAPARWRSLLAQITSGGAAVGELPCGTRPRRWGGAAATRIVAALAKVTIVVEAEDSWRELACASAARTLGRTVAAVPGRLTSRASSGTHTLLREGATLVRSPSDVLDLLYGADRPADVADDALRRLPARLRDVLEQVGAGADTPEKLIGGGGEPGELLQTLSELELLGLLGRGHGGRYVPRGGALGGRALRYGCTGQMEP